MLTGLQCSQIFLNGGDSSKPCNLVGSLKRGALPVAATADDDCTPRASSQAETDGCKQGGLDSVNNRRRSSEACWRQKEQTGPLWRGSTTIELSINRVPVALHGLILRQD